MELIIDGSKAGCPVCGHSGFNAPNPAPLPSDELECGACGTRTLVRELRPQPDLLEDRPSL